MAARNPNPDRSTTQRRLSRLHGQPPRTKSVPDGRQRSPKHKKRQTWESARGRR